MREHAIDSMRPFYDPRKLDIGQNVSVKLDKDANGATPVITEFSLDMSTTTTVEVTRAGEDFRVKKLDVPVERSLARAGGRINSSSRNRHRFRPAGEPDTSLALEIQPVFDLHKLLGGHREAGDPAGKLLHDRRTLETQPGPHAGRDLRVVPAGMGGASRLVPKGRVGAEQGVEFAE